MGDAKLESLVSRCDADHGNLEAKLHQDIANRLQEVARTLEEKLDTQIGALTSCCDELKSRLNQGLTKLTVRTVPVLMQPEADSRMLKLDAAHRRVQEESNNVSGTCQDTFSKRCASQLNSPPVKVMLDLNSSAVLPTIGQEPACVEICAANPESCSTVATPPNTSPTTPLAPANSAACDQEKLGQRAQARVHYEVIPYPTGSKHSPLCVKVDSSMQEAAALITHRAARAQDGVDSIACRDLQRYLDATIPVSSCSLRAPLQQYCQRQSSRQFYREVQYKVNFQAPRAAIEAP